MQDLFNFIQAMSLLHDKFTVGFSKSNVPCCIEIRCTFYFGGGYCTVPKAIDTTCRPNLPENEEFLLYLNEIAEEIEKFKRRSVFKDC